MARRFSPLATAITLAGLVAISAGTAYELMFSTFAYYDDEGYLLMSLKGYLSVGHLYDQVFTQYGPAYYEIFGAIFRLLGLPIDHDSGRLVTLAVWIASTLLLAVGTWALTRSMLLAISVYLFAFMMLASLTAEPMHPGGILNLLVCGILAAAALLLPRSGPIAMALIGFLAAIACLIKVNVGIFALASIGFACVCAYPSLSRIRGLRPAARWTLAAVPILLTAGQFSQGTSRGYGMYICLCAFALALAVAPMPADPKRKSAELIWLGAGFALPAALCIAIVFWQGTSPAGLVNGIVTIPLRQTALFISPVYFAPVTWLWVLVLLGPAFGLAAWRLRNANPFHLAPSTAMGVFRIAAGLLIWVNLAGSVGVPGLVRVDGPGPAFGLAPALAWLAALPPSRPGPTESAGFTRVLLPALGVMLTLQAYPVAGSQVFWACLLLIPVGAICIADGVGELQSWVATGSTQERRLLRQGIISIPVVLMLAGLMQSGGELWVRGHTRYEAASQLALPSAARLRLPPDQASTYRDLVGSVHSHCSTFISEPGLNSLYVFSGDTPPTWLNTTDWMDLLDDSTQQRVVDRANSIDQLCVVRSQHLIDFWSQDRAVRTGPLAAYIEANFEPIERFGEYELLVRRTQGVPRS
jgi:hypothetical protein